MKWRWRKKMQSKGKNCGRPNLITGPVQICWHKFCRYWDVEIREVPMSPDSFCMNVEEMLKRVDENTICVVPIQGVTWTGLNDDVEALDAALDEYNARTGHDIPIHVDAASGGFILPFLQPDKRWDFRLKWVLSISPSGHKYGLVYPGLGWVIWKDKKYLPGKMSFSVNYLGADITQVGLNFYRPGAQVLGQYYQFIRLGFEGYRQVQQNSMDIARYLHTEIGKMAPFKNYSADIVNPLFIWYMKEEYAKKAKWTLYDLQDKLKQSGWMVPAYTMPKKIEDSVEETLTYCDFPSEHWTRIRTNNVIERLNREIRRRTRVVGTFPDGNSALMPVCVQLRHVAGTQRGNKKYMNMKHLEAAFEDVSIAG